MKPTPQEPRLPTRDEYYDLENRLEWTPKYVSEEELFPVDMTGVPNLPIDVWAELYDAPYKVTYREYVKNQKEKDQKVFSVRDAGIRAELVKKLDSTYHQGAFCFHITAVPIPEYTAAIAEIRMARFAKAGEWRNLATFGSMDEVRHAQLQILLSHDNVTVNPKFAFAHKMFWTDGWLPIAARSFFDDTITGTTAIEFALLTTFAFETGFTNLQFIAYAAMANKANDFVFSTATQSIQTDESRHAQIGHPVLKTFTDVTKLSEELQKKV
ncbi:toluene hydroxylase [Acidianus manzaensis]|uniref:Toluene hydroxylase n=1 Tax=Acidianus manzaensis TaxID=282676 RepID=A0A1W6JWN2_9CREN|nr:toluene hydroxylase [Acidianus manzaensis]ARM74696.1 toluene hydroxylase [Acidianus manzaensis]